MIDGFAAYAPDLARVNDHFSEDAFGKLRSVEDWHWWFQSRNRLIVSMLELYASGFSSLLELGCGTGVVTAAIQDRFPTAKLFGTEIYSEGLKYARERLPEATLFQADGRNLPFDGSFDVVAAFDVLEHVDEDEDILANMCRTLRPGGVAIITVPQHPWLWSNEDTLAHHVRRYVASDMLEKLRRAGFTVVRMTSFVTLLLPLMFASRLSRAKPAPEADMGEFQHSRLGNSLLYAIARGEGRLIEAGLSFPVGGSLLVVARRSDSHEPLSRALD